MTVEPKLHEPAANDPSPPSPCIGVCIVDPATRRCRGCLRSIDEIATWYRANAAEKHTILARLAARGTAEGAE